jgi:hypothetical protein
MAGTHGDLFREIGALVVAAHEGEPIDLKAKGEELARRYVNLGMPADTIARAIARSASAVGVSMALMQISRRNAIHVNGDAPANSGAVSGLDKEAPTHSSGVEKSPAALFPSGVRLAVLS